MTESGQLTLSVLENYQVAVSRQHSTVTITSSLNKFDSPNYFSTLTQAAVNIQTGSGLDVFRALDIAIFESSAASP